MELFLTVSFINTKFFRLSSRVDITVQVEDINDNPPVFNPKYYRSVREANSYFP